MIRIPFISQHHWRDIFDLVRATEAAGKRLDEGLDLYISIHVAGDDLKLRAQEGNIRRPRSLHATPRKEAHFQTRVGEWDRRRGKKERRERAFKVKTSPQSRCHGFFFPQSDRSDVETGANSSKITSTGDWKAYPMTPQSRCECLFASVCMWGRALILLNE